MSHRNIELQVGIPKVTEVTKIQQIMQQQHLNQQADFEKAVQSQTQKVLQRPTSPDENRAVSHREGSSGSPGKEQKGKRKKNAKEQTESPHPYKGRNIDLRG